MNCWHCKTELIWGGDGVEFFTETKTSASKIKLEGSVE